MIVWAFVAFVPTDSQRARHTLVSVCFERGYVQRKFDQAGRCVGGTLNHILNHLGLCPGIPTPFESQAKYQNPIITAFLDCFSKSYSLPASNPSTHPSLHLPSASTLVPTSSSPLCLDGNPVSAFSLLSAQACMLARLLWRHLCLPASPSQCRLTHC